MECLNESINSASGNKDEDLESQGDKCLTTVEDYHI
jgi:hypothetical protein